MYPNEQPEHPQDPGQMKQQLVAIINKMLASVDVPPVLREHLRQQLYKQLSGTGQASFAIPLGGPESPFPFFRQAPPPQERQADIFPIPGTTVEEGVSASGERKLQDALGVTPRIDTAFMADMQALETALSAKEAIEVLLDDEDVGGVSKRMVSQLKRVIEVLLETGSDRVDDYIACVQHEEHDRKGFIKEHLHKEWMADTIQGRTLLGFVDWKKEVYPGPEGTNPESQDVEDGELPFPPEVSE